MNMWGCSGYIHVALTCFTWCACIFFVIGCHRETPCHRRCCVTVMEMGERCGRDAASLISGTDTQLATLTMLTFRSLGNVLLGDNNNDNVLLCDRGNETWQIIHKASLKRVATTRSKSTSMEIWKYENGGMLLYAVFTFFTYCVCIFFASRLRQ